MNSSIGHLTEADIARLAESAIRSLFQTLAGEFRRDNPVGHEWLLRRRSRLNDWIANAIRMEMEIETGRRLDRVPPGRDEKRTARLQGRHSCLVRISIPINEGCDDAPPPDGAC